MCPGHLVEKWKDSLEKEIPYAKPVIINSFKQLVDLRAAGRERNYGKEFYIISKENCNICKWQQSDWYGTYISFIGVGG